MSSNDQKTSDDDEASRRKSPVLPPNGRPKMNFLADLGNARKKAPAIPAQSNNSNSSMNKNTPIQWWALQDAPPEIRGNKEIILESVSKDWRALKHASSSLKADKDVVMAAVKHEGKAVLFAAESMRSDKEVMLACLRRDGNCLGFASSELRCDKECVITAATNRPESLKFAMGGLNQDRDCLIAAGLWDDDYAKEVQQSAATGSGGDTPQQDWKKIVLSTRFSLDENSAPTATQFTILLKRNEFFFGKSQAPDLATEGETRGGLKFFVYSPNAFSKGTCDPDWTDWEWPCRGTFETCTLEDSLKSGPPQQDRCCWRYSFRYHLQEACDCQGFMLQIVELKQQGDIHSYDYVHELGRGQAIERHMAEDIGMKVFVVYQPMNRKYRHRLEFEDDHIEELSTFVRKWYADGCTDMTICHVGERRLHDGNFEGQWACHHEL